MPSIQLQDSITLDALHKRLQAQLADRCSVEQGSNRIKLIESRAKGCIVSIREKRGARVCSVTPLMPSIALRAVTFAGVVALFSAGTTLFLGEFNIIGGGLIPLVVFFLLMGMPSRDLVGEVASIISRHVGCEDQAEPLRSRRWQLGLVGGVTLILLVSLGQFLWPEDSPRQTSSRSQVEETTERDPVSEITNDTDPLQTTTHPRIEYSVIAGMGGRIDFLHPDLAPGSIFQKGAVVARIDARDLQASKSRLDEQLKEYEAELSRLDDEYQWIADLRQVQTLNQQQVEELQAQAVSLSERRTIVATQTTELKQELKWLNARIARHEVKIPARMRIDRVNVQVDEFVTASQELVKGTDAQR